MEEQEIYTITVVRNIGIPISFTIKRWKVIFFTTLSAVVSVFLLAGSIDYFFLKLEANELSRQLASATKKSELLTEQLARLDHDRYWINADEKNKELAATRQAIMDQSDFSTEGIWITSKPTLSEEEFQEGMFIEVDGLNSTVNGDVLSLTVNLLNTSNPPQPLVGYISVTLVNNDQSPPLYQSVGGGEVGDNGFPSSYNSGKPYYIKRQTGSSQLKFKLTSVNEYYTDALVFLFSQKGTLRNKGQYPLNKEIFLE
jgi:hypothetical protein